MIYPPKVNEYIASGLITETRHPALYDYQFQLHLAEAPWNSWLMETDHFEVTEEYIDKIHDWILSTKNNSVLGLERFNNRDVIIGVTQSLDEAYFRYKDRNLRLFQHEYGYHRRNLDFMPLDNGDDYITLEENDWVIVSLPFSGLGKEIPLYRKMLKDAEEKNIPVVLDCAWFGTCKDIHVDLSSPAIKEVSFSLSKGIGFGNMRTGIRYSNYEQGPIRQQNNYKHLVKSNMQLALWQMERFGPDYVIDKYSNAYIQMCNDLGLTSTNCIHVAHYKDKLLGVRNLVKSYYKHDTHNK